MQLNYRDSKPIYEQIKEGIRRMIVMNVFKQDEKLPSVRVLPASMQSILTLLQRPTESLRRKDLFTLKVVKEPLLQMLTMQGGAGQNI